MKKRPKERAPDTPGPRGDVRTLERTLAASTRAEVTGRVMEAIFGQKAPSLKRIAGLLLDVGYLKESGHRVDDLLASGASWENAYSEWAATVQGETEGDLWNASYGFLLRRVTSLDGLHSPSFRDAVIALHRLALDETEPDQSCLDALRNVADVIARRAVARPVLAKRRRDQGLSELKFVERVFLEPLKRARQATKFMTSTEEIRGEIEDRRIFHGDFARVAAEVLVEYRDLPERKGRLPLRDMAFAMEIRLFRKDRGDEDPREVRERWYNLRKTARRRRPGRPHSGART